MDGYPQRLPLEGEVRIPSGCAISGIIDRSGKRFSAREAITSISVMHDRSNGLGGGFAGYGIYPEYKDYTALHIFYYSSEAKRTCEAFLEEHFDLINLSKIPTKKHPAITDVPLIWRYFVTALPTKLSFSQLDEVDVYRPVRHPYKPGIEGAYVFSSARTWVSSRPSDSPRM
jgi:glutamate synthase domain-containing protein 1